MKHMIYRFALWLIVRCAITRAKDAIDAGVFVGPVTLAQAVHETLEGEVFEVITEEAMYALGEYPAHA